ncbi:hypothetical protein WDU99_00255 [Microbacterium sp. Mu-80]|uniref:Uncharacterized protein n=1 Tax=Microbacterium bandirmense TaxID=3122050 RepID=A0ABU8L605_9MICO
MSTDKHHDASADIHAVHRASQQDPPPASEAAPDGQFNDQRMPTTDGEPADDQDSAASAGAESQEEGEAAMDAAEEATEDD